MTDNDYSRRLLSSAFNIYITNTRARSINIKRKAKSQKKGGSGKTGCRNKLHINLGVFWGALWAQLIPQPPSDNCSHKHCALIGSSLCCALSASPRQRWSRGSSGSRRRARWITHSWPSTPARTNSSSVPGIVNQQFFFFLNSLRSFFSSSPSSSFLVRPFIVLSFVSQRLSESSDRFLYRCFQNREKNALRIVVFVKPSQMRACIDVFVAIFIGLWHWIEKGISQI